MKHAVQKSISNRLLPNCIYDFEQLDFFFMPYGSLLKTGADDQSVDIQSYSTLFIRSSLVLLLDPAQQLVEEEDRQLASFIQS